MPGQPADPKPRIDHSQTKSITASAKALILFCLFGGEKSLWQEGSAVRQFSAPAAISGKSHFNFGLRRAGKRPPSPIENSYSRYFLRRMKNAKAPSPASAKLEGSGTGTVVTASNVVPERISSQADESLA